MWSQLGISTSDLSVIAVIKQRKWSIIDKSNESLQVILQWS